MKWRGEATKEDIDRQQSKEQNQNVLSLLQEGKLDDALSSNIPVFSQLVTRFYLTSRRGFSRLRKKRLQWSSPWILRGKGPSLLSFFSDSPLTRRRNAGLYDEKGNKKKFQLPNVDEFNLSTAVHERNLDIPDGS